MSYERPDSMSRLEQYRARQAERMSAMNRAIDEGKTTVVLSGKTADESPRKEVAPEAKIGQHIPLGGRVIFGKTAGSVHWFGSRKSLTAQTIHSNLRSPMQVRTAAPITVTVQLVGAEEPRHGQLFSYDAENNQLVAITQFQEATKSPNRNKRRNKPLGSQPTRALAHKHK